MQRISRFGLPQENHVPDTREQIDNCAIPKKFLRFPSLLRLLPTNPPQDMIFPHDKSGRVSEPNWSLICPDTLKQIRSRIVHVVLAMHRGTPI